MDEFYQGETEIDEDDCGPDLISLLDENGEELEFEIVDTLEDDGEIYYALTPYDNCGEEPEEDGEEEAGELCILKIDDEAEEDGVFVQIEDDDEYDRIVKLFGERPKFQQYDIEYEEDLDD